MCRTFPSTWHSKLTKSSRRTGAVARAVSFSPELGSAPVEYYVWDDETEMHAGPFTRLELVEKDLPAGTSVCTGDGSGRFSEWQDVTDFITPTHAQPRVEEAYWSAANVPYGQRGRTRQQSAAMAAQLRKQSSVNEKAKGAASRAVGGS